MTHTLSKAKVGLFNRIYYETYTGVKGSFDQLTECVPNERPPMKLTYSNTHSLLHIQYARNAKIMSLNCRKCFDRIRSKLI